MTIDLMGSGPDLSTDLATYLVARLAEEAGVCVERDAKTGEIEEDPSNRACLHQAEYDIINGLVVCDRHGRRWRLRVTAEGLPPLEPLYSESLRR